MQLPIAQIEDANGKNEIVQLPTAQIDCALKPMPIVLFLNTFTNHIEILNRCEQRNK